MKRLFAFLVLFFSFFTCNNYLTDLSNRLVYSKTLLKVKMNELIYDNLVTENKEEFIKTVKDIARRLGIDPNWIMAVMYIETIGKFTPNIVNPYTGATGLIQFMPKTAEGLRTTTEKLAAMTNVEQLDYVYRYLFPYRKQINSFVDCYFAVFFPLAIGRPDEFVLETGNLSASKIAEQNPIYDLNHDGRVTVMEVETSLLSKIRPEYHPYLKKKR